MAVDVLSEGVGGILRVVFGWGAVALIVGAPLGYFGAFGMTGSDYYNTCWEMSHAWGELTSPRALPQPKSPAQALSWPQCERVTRRAVEDEGIVVVERGALAASCPVLWKDAPLYVATINFVVEDGGPGFFDKFLPNR